MLLYVKVPSLHRERSLFLKHPLHFAEASTNWFPLAHRMRQSKKRILAASYPKNELDSPLRKRSSD